MDMLVTVEEEELQKIIVVFLSPAVKRFRRKGVN